MKKYRFKIHPVFPIKIENSEIKIGDDEKRRMWKLAHSEPDGDYLLEIRKKVKKRSIKQNKTLWGIPVKMIYEHTFGQFEDDEEVYHFLEEKFSPRKIKTFGGANTFVKTPIKKLDSVTFGEVYLKIQQWASQFLNLDIPDPDPDYHLKPDKYL